MTMFATIINSGNRTADILTVRHGKTSTKLRRGERVKLGIPVTAHDTVLLLAEHDTEDPNDAFVGEPAIVVTTERTT